MRLVIFAIVFILGFLGLYAHMLDTEANGPIEQQRIHASLAARYMANYSYGQ